MSSEHTSIAHPVTSQPGAPEAQLGEPGRWSTSIFNCFNKDGCCDSLKALFLAPCYIKTNAEFVGYTHPILCGTVFCLLYLPALAINAVIVIPLVQVPSPTCCLHAPIRGRIRAKYGIHEWCWGEDWIYTMFCTPCAIRQEIHEIAVRQEHEHKTHAEVMMTK